MHTPTCTHNYTHTHTLHVYPHTHTHVHKHNTHTHTHTHTCSFQDGERLKHWSPVPGYISATQGSIPFSLLQSPVSGAVRNSTRGLGFTLEVECLVQHQKIVQYVSHRVPRVRQEQPGGSQALRQRSCLLVSAFDFRMMV